ncbi:MAG: VCBS repeat-containing protein [Planctomycetes bacterium]|nr:VCBS repeat-containing protein [Planctomycetota bacterium]
MHVLALSIRRKLVGLAAALGVFGLGHALECEARAAPPTAGPVRMPQQAPTPPKPPFRLRTRLEYPMGLGSHPQGLLLRDLDGDGRPELVGLTISPGALQVSSGYSPERTELAAAPFVHFGDWGVGPAWLDATGKDPATSGLVAVAPRDPSVLLLVDARAVWQGESETAVRWRTPLPRRARFLTTGDLDGDGHPEVLVTTVDDDLVVCEAQDSTRSLHLCDDHASCMALLGSGKGFVVGFQGSRRLVLYVPTKANPFGFEPGPALQLDGLPRKLLVCDFDGDGDDELAVALGDRSLWILGAGSPGGVPAAIASTPLRVDVASVPIDLCAGEFDGRPGAEIVCISLAGQALQVLAWQDGKLRTLAREYAGQSPISVACGDLDGDGHTDIAIANDSAERWSVCFGGADGGLEVAREARCGRSPHALAAGDLDGDGKPDVVTLNALEGSLSVIRGTAQGLGEAQTLIRAPSADNLRLADADGDGHLDALWLASRAGHCTLQIAFGDGKAGLWERAAVAPLEVGRSHGDLLVADLDGDGAPELLVSDPEESVVRLFTRRSAAGAEPRFEEAARIAAPGGPGPLALLGRQGASWRIASGLLGNTERKGVLIGEFAKSDAGEWSGDARGFVPLGSGVRALCSADLDGDARADLALLVSVEGQANAGAMLPVFAEPDGSFTTGELFPTGMRPYAIAAADLDADGRADVVISAQNSHQLELWRSNPANARGLTRTPDLGVGTGPLGLLLADLDGDGVPEILCANAFSDDISVIRTR